MIRTLLASTALVTVLTAGAFAQDTTTPVDPNAAPATEAPATDAPMAPADTAPAAPADTTMTTDTTVEAPASILATGYTVTDVDNLATEIIGRQVYSSQADDAEHIGDINNLVIGENGQVAAVVIGVGGFLGIGEKNVAVNYSELEWVVAEDNTERYILPTTKEALEAAPDFRAEDQTRPTDNNMAPADNNMAPADGAMVPADPNAAPADNMAPADSNMAPADSNMAPADGAMAPMAPVTGPIDRTALTDAPLTAEELIGTNAYGPADEHLGAIGDVILGSDASTVEGVIIDFGGFLGIGTKPVAVSIENLRYALDENRNEYLFVNVTREQLDQAPAYDANTFDADRNSQYLRTNAM
jgi:sporulation protein YlmC with PRC-barrel domain